MKPFDLEAAKNGAKVITRDGRKARIICFDAMHRDYTIVALIINESGTETAYTFTRYGRFYSCGDKLRECDLLMAPVKKECWINFYGVGSANPAFDTKERANSRPAAGIISCIHHTWEE